MLDPQEFNGAEKQPERLQNGADKAAISESFVIYIYMNMEGPVLALQEHQININIPFFFPIRGAPAVALANFFWRFSRLLAVLTNFFRATFVSFSGVAPRW